jgi:hypothetical protein
MRERGRETEEGGRERAYKVTARLTTAFSGNKRNQKTMHKLTENNCPATPLISIYALTRTGPGSTEG